MTNETLQAAKPRVLIVDDHPDAADTLASLVSVIFDCTVSIAYSGAEALAVAEVIQPQLVILDVTMPRMDGCETARRMRERPWGQKASIFALTVWADEASRASTRAAGFDLHLTKPLSVDDLLAALAKLRG